jgi:hypothetical protein
VTNSIRVMLEIGPKGKKVVAVAPEWPGLARGAKNGEAATHRLLAYVPRYAIVAKRAGMDGTLAEDPPTSGGFLSPFPALTGNPCQAKHWNGTSR